VDQPTTFEVKNDYAVILGQAQVVKSVTTSWNATAAKVGAEWVFTANKVGDSAQLQPKRDDGELLL
jgi:hypothetical protein